MGCDTLHNRIWDMAFWEPCPETLEIFPHEIKDKTNMRAIWTVVFKVVHQMANVIISNHVIVTVS